MVALRLSEAGGPGAHDSVQVPGGLLVKLDGGESLRGWPMCSRRTFVRANASKPLSGAVPPHFVFVGFVVPKLCQPVRSVGLVSCAHAFTMLVQAASAWRWRAVCV